MATAIVDPLPSVDQPSRGVSRTATPGILLLYLPPEPGMEVRWTRFQDGRGALNGSGIERLPDIAVDRLVAVAPASAVGFHWGELGGLSSAQARAAARLLVAETSLARLDTLHVAVGRELGDDGNRPVAVVDARRMADWLAMLERAGLDPDAVVPAPLLLPPPDEGYVRAELGGETIYRARNGAFADEPGLTELLIEDRPVAPLAGRELDDAVRAAADDPILDLRQGPFARSRRLALDWAHIRRLAWIALGIATLSLLISLAGTARYLFAADAVEREAAEIARVALPRGAAGDDPVALLDRALAAERGGGLGFTTTGGVLFGAVQATPGVELTGIDFGADGVLRASVRGPGAPEIEALIDRIEASGFAATPSPFAAGEGRVTGEIRMALP